MSGHSKVAIFWDYENCSPPSSSCGLGYDIVNNISRIARIFGSVTTFRAYLDVSARSPKSVALRSELQSSGLSIVDCPHNGKKDVVDKMILVDMLAFAIDHPTPATIILITGDRDYAYAVSTLKLRKYQVILVAPSFPHTPSSLESQASLVIDWGAAALRTRTEAADSTRAVRQPYFDLDASLVNKLKRELQDVLDDTDVAMHPHSTPFQSVPKLRRITTRDLLEPLRYSQNTGCLDSAQESTPAPASPKKSTSTGSDSAPGARFTPRTPLRPQSASASTQARSTNLAQSPSAVERDIPTTIPPPPSARRSSSSDTIDIGPAECSPPVLPLFDTLELPLHESRPPSSITVRSPLGFRQSIPGSSKETIHSSHKLNCLASPFVMTKAPTRPDSIPSSCTQRPPTAARPTPPTVVPTETVTQTHMKAIGDPSEIEHLTRLHTQGHDTNPGRSITYPIHSEEVTRNAADTPESNYHFYVAPHKTQSPSSRNVGLHLTGTPLSKQASSAAIPLGASDAVDFQFAASSRASNTLGRSRSTPSSESVCSSSAFPSTPSTTTPPHEHDGNRWQQTWSMFEPLIDLLLAARERGIVRPLRSTIALELAQSDKQVYQRVGVSRFRDYTALAEQAGIIELGGRDGNAWIALPPSWFGMDDITTLRFQSNGASSPTPDPSKMVQNPSLISSKTPLIQRAVVFETQAFTSPRLDSLESRTTLLASPIQRNSASRACIPAQFQPLLDALVRMRAEGFDQVLRSVVGQLLSQDVYALAGASGFKEYVHQASDAQLVQFGGVGGHAWIRLHPELRI